MIINKLYIKNFKNIKEIDLDFSNQKIILLLGETGSGKSSIFDAIVYSLSDHLEEKIVEYIRWGCDSFEIKSSFVHLNHNYDIEIIAGKTTKKKLIIDGSEECLNSEATKKLNEIIDANLLLYSAVSLQGQSTSLLSETSSVRLKKLREILKINKVIESADLMREDAKIEKDKLDKLQSEIQVLEGLKFIYMDLPVVENISNLENEFNLLQEKKKQFDSEMILWNQYNKELEAYEKAKRDLFIIQDRIKTIESEKDKIDIKSPIIFNKDSYDSVVSEINKINIDKLKYDQLIKDYEKYLSDRADYEYQIEELSAKNNDIKLSRIKPVNYTDEQIQKMESELRSYAVVITKLQEKIELAKSGKCPTCEQSYIILPEILEVELEEIGNKNKNLILEFGEAKADKNRFEKETKEQDKLRNDKQSIQDKIDMIQKQFDKLIVIQEPEKKDFDTKYNELTILKNSLEKDKKELEEIEQYNQKQNLKLNSLETQIKSYQEQIDSLNEIKQPESMNDEPQFDTTNYDSVKLKIDLHKQKQDELERVVLFNRELKQNEDTTKDKINLLTDQVQKIRSDIRVLEESRSLIEKKFSGYLIEKGTLYIKEKMNEFFQRSYGRYKISLGQDKSSIDFFYSDGVHKETPCGIASGFERQIISVANRVALSGIQNLGILMLDEADSESSSIRSEMLYKTLLNEKFNQMFIITHKDNTQEYLSNQPNSGVYEIVNGEVI